MSGGATSFKRKVAASVARSATFSSRAEDDGRGTKKTHIALRDLFRTPARRRFRLSPCGTRISYLKPWHGRANIFVQPVPEGPAERVTAERTQDIADYYWKNDDTLIYRAGAGLRVVDLTTGKARDVSPPKAAGFNVLDPLIRVSPQEVLLEVISPGEIVSHVCRLNISAGGRKIITVARHPDPARFGTIMRWIVDSAGRVRAAISVSGTKEYLLYRPDEESAFRIVRKCDFRYSIDRFGPLVLEGERLYAISRLRRNRDTAAVAVISARTGRETRCIYCHPRVDVERFAFSTRRKVVTHAVFRDEKLRQKCFGRNTRRVLCAVVRRLGDYAVEIVDQTDSETKFVVIVSSDRLAGRFYFVDLAAGRKPRVTSLGEFAPWLRQKDMVRVEPIQFRSRDGLLLHGYLALPPGRRPNNLPLVLNVHGGPEIRDVREYTRREGAEVQFFANRGYAVLQLNFRGSTGYGRKFWMKGFREHGRKMQTDLNDGVRWLIRRGIADPKRVIIYGKSYGGYAALVGVTFRPKNLYKAAICYSGISNWLDWLENFPAYNRPLLRQFYVKVGDPERDRKRLQAVAPALHTDSLGAPVFIAHGERDDRAPIRQAKEFVANLRRRGVLVQCMFKRDEGHVFETEKNRIEFYRAVERFLAKYLR